MGWYWEDCMRDISKERLHVFKGRCHIILFPMYPMGTGVQQVVNICYFKWICAWPPCRFSFLFFFLIAVQLQLSAFSPLPPTPPQTNPPPSSTSTLPLGFGHASSTVVPENPSPHYPLPTPLWLLLDCSYLQCLWLYFVCFFLLLIRFQLKKAVRDKYHVISPLTGTPVGSHFTIFLCFPLKAGSHVLKDSIYTTQANQNFKNSDITEPLFYSHHSLII